MTGAPPEPVLSERSADSAVAVADGVGDNRADPMERAHQEMLGPGL